MTRIAMMLVVLLAACTPRGTFESFGPATSIDATQTIFVATQRDGASLLSLTGERRQDLRYGQINVTIPQDHEPGQIEWQRDGKGFGVAETHSYASEVIFQKDISNHAAQSDSAIMVFVPGYNMTMAEATFRQAQIAHDYAMTGPQVLFAWPSAAQPLGYIQDRDSAMFARDGLEQVLTDLAQSQNRRILVVGHSMGGHLVTETLRQMSIGRNRATATAFEGVILISPDIDIDLFQTQLNRIEPLPDPFILVVSQRDRALRLSARLSGQTRRLGSLDDVRRLAQYPITVLDLTEIDGNGDQNHLIPATSPVAITLLRGLRETGLPAPPPDDSAIQAVQVVLRLPE
ncbi:alpha/beta fold hydrolase [Loktanella sp. 5RATIMAR09]|uniref:alpha/beta hydrolase n=1 Tax=Loktanella sp. 5RATIMAR09 TaxID=1225655 RepID=UPI0006EB6902|nr:alpha/beta fold hydrolase [Loktanella sp. 5RATIMAR09]